MNNEQTVMPTEC